MAEDKQVIVGYIVKREVPPSERWRSSEEIRPETFVLVINGDEDEIGSLPRQFRERSTHDVVIDPMMHHLSKFNEYLGEIVGPDYQWAWVEDGKLKKEGEANTRIPHSVVKNAGLENGDLVEIRVDHKRKAIGILSVNGEKDFSKVHSWPRFIGPGAKIGRHPEVIMPLGHHSRNWRVLEIMSPFAWGNCGYLDGEGGAGKTVIALEFVSAVARMAKEVDNVHIIVIFIDEHTPDSVDYQKIYKQGVEDGVNIEYFVALEADSPEIQWSIYEWGMSRAKRLVEAARHVVVLIESVVRPVDAFAGSGLLDEKTSLTMKGGIPREAYWRVKQSIGGAGWLGVDGSFTVMCVCLNERGSDLTEFVRKTSTNVPTWNAALIKNERLGKENRPWVVMYENKTNVRRIERFIPPELHDEREKVFAYMSSTKDPRAEDNPPYEKHRLLLEFVRTDGNSNPPYDSGWALDKLRKGETTSTK